MAPQIDKQVVVECAGVEKRFARTRALRGVDFRLCRGELVVLEGPNGAGKSTLLKCLAGVVRIDRGVVRRSPENCWDKKGKRLRCGLFLQHPMLYQHLTGVENLVFFSTMLGQDNTRQRVQRVIDHFGLSDFIERRVDGCSPGMQRKIALARVFLVESPIVLLDEPFASIDTQGKTQVCAAISEIVDAGGAAVIVSHESSDLLPNRRLLLQAGRIECVSSLNNQSRSAG